MTVTVTDIQPFNKKRYRVYIDGEYLFPLYTSELRKYSISVGNELSTDILDEIGISLVRRIRERILYLIGDTDKSEYDIRKKLIQSGYTENYITPAIDSIKEYGYIDDNRYARRYAESMKDNHGKTRYIIENKLRLHGISKDIIEDVIGSMKFDDTAMILEELRKKRISSDQIMAMDFKERNRIYGYLLRKGYSYSSVNSALRIDDSY